MNQDYKKQVGLIFYQMKRISYIEFEFQLEKIIYNIYKISTSHDILNINTIKLKRSLPRVRFF